MAVTLGVFAIYFVAVAVFAGGAGEIVIFVTVAVTLDIGVAGYSEFMVQERVALSATVRTFVGWPGDGGAVRINVFYGGGNSAGGGDFYCCDFRAVRAVASPWQMA